MGWVLSAFSKTDLGARLRVDMICRTNASPRKTAPPHQLTLVSRFPACLTPISASGDELAPPKLAARPPPFPLWARMAPITRKQSITRIVNRIV